LLAKSDGAIRKRVAFLILFLWRMNRAIHSNLFGRKNQKGFPLLSLAQTGSFKNINFHYCELIILLHFLILNAIIFYQK
jgi:hypothetical protein